MANDNCVDPSLVEILDVSGGDHAGNYTLADNGKLRLNGVNTGYEITVDDLKETGVTYTIQIRDGVTSIEMGAFFNCTGLTSVTIPNSVTSIGVSAFNNCTGLTSVTIPDSVTSIGNNAFQNCTGLTSVIIPDSITSIGNNVFINCKGLTSVTIPDSVDTIGNFAFFNCTRLTSVTIPDSVTSIGFGAFSFCYGLRYGNVQGQISETIYSKNTGAWNNCFLVQNVYDNLNLTNQNIYYPTDIEIYNENGVELEADSILPHNFSISIKNIVTSIGTNAFEKCTGLTSVTIPDSVTSIGNFAFFDCTGLTSVTIGNSVKTIGNRAFRNCTGLETILFNFPDPGSNNYTTINNVSKLPTKNGKDEAIIYGSDVFIGVRTLTVQYEVKGCMDNNAANYNALATEDDGSCFIVGYSIGVLRLDIRK